MVLEGLEAVEVEAVVEAVVSETVVEAVVVEAVVEAALLEMSSGIGSEDGFGITQVLWARC